MKPNDVAIKNAEQNGYVNFSDNPQVNDAILDSFIAQIAVLDANGIIQKINKAWRIFDEKYAPYKSDAGNLLGINYPEVCRNCNGLFSDKAPLAYNGIMSVLNGGENSFTLEYITCISNSNHWFIMSVTALPGITGAVVSHTDITELKTVENMREEFFSIASHEFKTPITSLKGIAHILKLSFGEKVNREATKLLNTMEIQLNKLTKLIEDLLVVNTKHGHNFILHKAEFTFQKLVKETVENVKNISPLHFITIKENENFSYMGDKLRLEQVITNLLTNAVKYSPHSNQIFISSVVKSNAILFSVQDFGLGLKKENSKKIFERFYRVDNEYTITGLGLGLYIAAEIINAHDGNLWVESEVGKGSTFYFSLPLNRI